MKFTSAIAMVSILTFSSALASPTFAKFVTQIPVIGNVFNYFAYEKEFYKAYGDLSTDMGITEKSNGVEMVIDQAIYDGNMVTLSYIIRTKKEFSNLPMFESLPIVQGNLNNANNYVEYVKDVGYVGVMTLPMFEDKRKTVNIEWEPKSISSDKKIIQGNWSFKFSLEEIPSTHITINQEISKNGVTVRLIDARKTDINLSINYSQMVDPTNIESIEYVETELYAIDNLGNKYEVPYNAGSGVADSASGEDIIWNATIHGLDEQATSLTFFPFAHISIVPSESDESNSKKIDFEPITINLK